MRHGRRAAVAAAAGLAIGGAVVLPAGATADGIGVDGPFNTALGSGFDGEVASVTELTGGDLLVGGAFRRLDGRADIPQGLVRLRADGSPDTDFARHLGTGLSGSVASAAELPGGDLVVGGRFDALDGAAAAPDNLVRLHADGSPDTGFNTALGTGPDGGVTEVRPLQDGDLLVVGSFDTVNGVPVPHGVVRLEPDGSVDAAFAAALGAGFGNRVSTAMELPGGDLLIAGSPAAGRPYYLARLHADGSADSAFNAALGTGFNGAVDALAVLPDGDVLVGGSFNTLNGSTQVPRGLVRLNPDGSRDAGFDTTMGGGFAGAVDAIAVLPGGDLMVAGSFSSFDGDPAIPANLLRLRPDGAMQTVIDAALGTGLDADALALAPVTGGGVLVGGEFRALNGSTAVADGLVLLRPVDVTLPVVADRSDPAGIAVDVPLPVATTAPAATGWPLDLVVSGLPDGLTLDPVSGRVTGTPATAGSYPVQLSATLHPVTAPLTDHTAFTWTITPAAVAPTPTPATPSPAPSVPATTPDPSPSITAPGNSGDQHSADAGTGVSSAPTRLLALTGPALALVCTGAAVLLGTGIALLLARRRGRLG